MKTCQLQLHTLPLGQWATNCYILTCGQESLIVDPAAEPERILAAVAGPPEPPSATRRWRHSSRWQVAHGR